MAFLLEIGELKIEGQGEGDRTFEIVKGISLNLARREVLELFDPHPVPPSSRCECQGHPIE